MELSAVLEKSVHIRRLKADVLDQLPHKQRSVKRVPLGGSFVQVYLHQACSPASKDTASLLQGPSAYTL